MNKKNILLESVIFLVFHFEISGNSVNDEHSEKIPDIFLTFSIFQIEIFDNSFRDEHSQKASSKSITLSIFHF